MQINHLRARVPEGFVVAAASGSIGPIANRITRSIDCHRKAHPADRAIGKAQVVLLLDDCATGIRTKCAPRSTRWTTFVFTLARAHYITGIVDAGCHAMRRGAIQSRQLFEILDGVCRWRRRWRAWTGAR